MSFREPYALYTGPQTDRLRCKTATGVAHWSPERVACQVVESDRPFYKLSPDIPVVVQADQAWQLGARSLVIAVNGIAGVKEHIDAAAQAFAKVGFDVVGTQHEPLDNLEFPHGGQHFEVRKLDPSAYLFASGRRRPGLRLLTVGCDMCVGKKFTSVAIYRAAKKAGMKVDWRPTGQTGGLIAGPDARAIVVDSTPCDFISGATEWLAPDNEPDHWDVIEGQATLSSPGGCCCTMGLLMGAQADLLVYCIDPARRTMLLSDPAFEVLPLLEDVADHLRFSRRVNPASELGAVSLNLSGVSAEEGEAAYQATRRTLDAAGMTNVPVFDPSVDGASLAELIRRMKLMSAAVERLPS